ncbi:MAG: diguanylate cyclase [Armatimonadota bacterium]
MPGVREDLAGRLWPEKLQEVQDALSRSFSVPILVAEPSGRPVTACEDISRFCRRLTRQVPVSRPCLHCGRADGTLDPVDREYDQIEREAVHDCPLGVSDVAAPIYLAGETIGYLLSPQVVVHDRRQRCDDEPAPTPGVSLDDYAGWLAACPSMALSQLLGIESALAAASWLLGALAAARRRNLRLAERLREQGLLLRDRTFIDAVTGVSNRRRLMEYLAAEVRRVRRYHRPMSLAVIEISAFRETCDQFGHDVGDSVLAAVANCLTSTLRQTDCIGRVGAETFAVIMPETIRTQALCATGRVLLGVDDLNASGDLPVEVRVAVGIVDSVMDPEDMLRSAVEAATLSRVSGTPAVLPA